MPEKRETETPPPLEVVTLETLPDGPPATVTAPQLRGLLWERVSITRDGAGMEEAEVRLRRWLGGYRPRATRGSVELANMLLVGWHMTRAALRRDESRGAHYRYDFPETVPVWRRRVAVRLAVAHPLTLP